MTLNKLVFIDCVYVMEVIFDWNAIIKILQIIIGYMLL